MKAPSTLRGKRTQLRPAAPEDLDLLTAWLADPEVYRWWGGQPVPRATVERKYVGHRRPAVESFVIEVDGKPVGYAQYDRKPDGSVGVDMFLAALAQGRGLGPDAARTLALYLEREVGVPRITVDPVVANPRAVRAWARAGFRHERDVPDGPEGPAVLMVFAPRRHHAAV
jgi:aminoglycoside 6'-N-acetyltransferase